MDPTTNHNNGHNHSIDQQQNNNRNNNVNYNNNNGSRAPPPPLQQEAEDDDDMFASSSEDDQNHNRATTTAGPATNGAMNAPSGIRPSDPRMMGSRTVPAIPTATSTNTTATTTTTSSTTANADQGIGNTGSAVEENVDANATNDNDDPSSVFTNFELIDNVEWGPRPDEDGYDTDQELVPRPIKSRSKEVCYCRPQPGACQDLSCILFACNEECHKLNCPAGQFCGNQRIQTKQYPPLQVIDAGLKGKGLICLHDVHKGDLLCEYTGRAVKETKLKTLFRRYQFDRRLYIMGLGYGVYLDARHKGGLARYINHSCSPNCRVDRWTVKGILRAVVVAITDIPANTELTFDYQWERKRGRAPTKCHCQSPNCRGTLEVKKSLEESNLEVQLQGHWERYSVSSSTLDHTIVNRTIRVKDQATDEYFLGEITGYDPQTKLHSVLYRHDMSEAWEDLSKEDWMILNAKMDENFMIAKKAKRPTSKGTSQDDSKRLLGQQSDAAILTGVGPVKHYLYIQTAIKNALYGKHLIEFCQRNCSVQITAEQFARPPLPPGDDPEELEKYAALDVSPDGTVWKLTLAGVDVASAHNFLEQQNTILEKKMEAEAQASQRQAIVLANAVTGGAGADAASSTAVGGDGSSPGSSVTEIVYPRTIADAVKRKLQSLRERCKGVTIVVAPSYSKSKQFARLILEGSETLFAAQEIVWHALVGLCREENVPMVHNVPVNMGFLGGVLSSDQFRMFLNHGDVIDATTATSSNISAVRSLSMDAGENLRSQTSFFASFETTQRCSVWVQAEDDKGRINGENKIVQEANDAVKQLRKVYIGCEPKDLSRLWGYIHTRATELQRGVKFLHLGLDRVYQVVLMKSQVFDFVQQVSGAAVTVDSITGDHLCMDGRTGRDGTNYDVTRTEEERASLAKELIRLQIEIYRDHWIREQNWMFGRDWTIVAGSLNSSGHPNASSPPSMVASTSGSSLSTAIKSFGQLDRRTAVQGAFEIAEVVTHLGVPGKVGAHAATILYRYVSIKESFDLKVREVLLACVFLANKCQKEGKWKRMEAVLEAGYETFYPGTKFDPTSEEALVLEDRVLAAEKDILHALDFDVFWRDVEWITSAAMGEGRMRKEKIEGTFEFVFSGPVLGAGAELWLKYGVDYIFAAGAALLKADVSAIVPALSLIALKVAQTAELIVESANLARPIGKNAKCPSILAKESGRVELDRRLPRIKEACNAVMRKVVAAGPSASTSVSAVAAAVDQRYKIIRDRSRRRFVIRTVPELILSEHLLPVLDKVAAASSCSIYVRRNQVAPAEDLVLDGSWRAIAVAEHLLRKSIPPGSALPQSMDATTEFASQSNFQAKVEPGRVSAADIHTSVGWDGTIQSMISNETVKGRRIGGKSCVAGRVSEAALRKSGLRWWIPPKHGASLSGSINDMVIVRSANPPDILSVLRDIACSVVGQSSDDFPILTGGKNGSSRDPLERFTAVSVQQWPSDKVCQKETEKRSKSKGKAMQMGFSAAALQEMQLLTRLHALIATPCGHPNFILPVGLAIASDSDAKPKESASNQESKKRESNLSVPEDPMFSLFRSSTENEKVAEKEKNVKERPHLVFQPTPFVMHTFLSKSFKRHVRKELRCNHALLSAWFHDLLSALVHCHSSNVVMRTIQADQIVIDHSGTAKFGGLYRCTIVSPEERKESSIDSSGKDAKKAREKNKRKRKKDMDDDEDMSKDLFQAPEILLGSPKHTKESDVWSMGCLLATLLLGKPLFVGKSFTRQDLLTCQYKIVGSPDKRHFTEGTKLPHFVKTPKRYKRGVEKALEHMLKLDEHTTQQHHKTIDLISKMLHLDPNDRCTAEQALSHDFMVEYLEQCNTVSFREQYVREWVSLKETMLQVADAEREERAAEDMFRKRQAMLLAASRSSARHDDQNNGKGSDNSDNDDDDDDDDGGLYDLDDVLEAPPAKRHREVTFESY